MLSRMPRRMVTGERGESHRPLRGSSCVQRQRASPRRIAESFYDVRVSRQAQSVAVDERTSESDGDERVIDDRSIDEERELDEGDQRRCQQHERSGFFPTMQQPCRSASHEGAVFTSIRRQQTDAPRPAHHRAGELWRSCAENMFWRSVVAGAIRGGPTMDTPLCSACIHGVRAAIQIVH